MRRRGRTAVIVILLGALGVGALLILYMGLQIAHISKVLEAGEKITERQRVLQEDMEAFFKAGFKEYDVLGTEAEKPESWKTPGFQEQLQRFQVIINNAVAVHDRLNQQFSDDFQEAFNSGDLDKLTQLEKELGEIEKEFKKAKKEYDLYMARYRSQ